MIGSILIGSVSDEWTRGMHLHKQHMHVSHTAAQETEHLLTGLCVRAAKHRMFIQRQRSFTDVAQTTERRQQHSPLGMLQVSRDQQFAEELQEQEHLLDHCAENRHRAVLESEADTRLAEQLQAEEEVCTSATLLPFVADPAFPALHSSVQHSNVWPVKKLVCDASDAPRF